MTAPDDVTLHSRSISADEMGVLTRICAGADSPGWSDGLGFTETEILVNYAPRLVRIAQAGMYTIASVIFPDGRLMSAGDAITVLQMEVHRQRLILEKISKAHPRRYPAREGASTCGGCSRTWPCPTLEALGVSGE